MSKNHINRATALNSIKQFGKSVLYQAIFFRAHSLFIAMQILLSENIKKKPTQTTFVLAFSCCALGTRYNSAVKVRYRLGSRNC